MVTSATESQLHEQTNMTVDTQFTRDHSMMY